MSEPRAIDELLLPRVARGDADAVEACLARFAPLVWSLAKRLAREPSGLEELVQEIFVDVWRSAGRFDPEKASEATFIATIARRRIIDRRRRAERTPRIEELEVLEAAGAVGEEPGFARVELADEAGRAMEALARIRPEQRRLILKSVVDGLTHEEIATSTGLPLGTVKSHIRRGLDRAARILRAPRTPSAPAEGERR